MDKFPDRLKKLRSATGLTQGQLADKLHMAQRTVSHWEQGLRTPSWPVVQAIATALGVKPSELGDVPMSPEPPAKPTPKGRPTVLVEVPLPELRQVPIVGTVGAGPATDHELHNVVSYVLASVKGVVVGYQVVGRSMESELIGHGDHVFVRTDPAPRAGEMVVAWVDKLNGMVLKRLKGKGDYRWLESDDGFSHVVADEDKVYGAFVGLHRPGPKR